MVVEVYTKPGCPLCEEMLDLFDEVTLPEGQPRVHNILERNDWFDAYRYRVPVVVIDGKPTLELRFTLEQLKKALNP
ncbi:MAG: glutaredoxin family protein [Myxococcaceae bacterium]